MRTPTQSLFTPGALSTHAEESSVLPGAPAAATPDASTSGGSASKSTGKRPPRSCYARFREKTLRMLSMRIFNWLGILWAIGVVGSGAMMFFLMIGVNNLSEAGARYWTNVSIQILCALFTYTALITLPWRLFNAVHLCSTHCAAGCDFDGDPSDEIWWHIPPRRRVPIVAAAVLNSLFQLVNQAPRYRRDHATMPPRCRRDCARRESRHVAAHVIARTRLFFNFFIAKRRRTMPQATRIVYRDYDSSNKWPGSLMVNMFFLLSLLCGVFAGLVQWREESRLRAADPDTWPPGPIALLSEKLAEAHEMRRAALEGMWAPGSGSSPPPAAARAAMGLTHRANVYTGMTARTSDALEGFANRISAVSPHAPEEARAGTAAACTPSHVQPEFQPSPLPPPSLSSSSPRAKVAPSAGPDDTEAKLGPEAARAARERKEYLALTPYSC